MSRHRDIRCMKYSDEYDGYDDVYGHSVEDDYCVSPSAEQFLFDRSKQQNIASFITEPDIVEDNEDVDETTPPQEGQLTDVELAKLSSCEDLGKNENTDTVSDSDSKTNVVKEPTATNEQHFDQYQGATSAKAQSASFTIPKISFKQKDSSTETTLVNSSFANTLGNLRNLAVNNPSTPFSSLSDMINKHNVSGSPNSTQIFVADNSQGKSFTSLADLTSHHLKSSNTVGTSARHYESNAQANHSNFMVPNVFMKKEKQYDETQNQSFKFNMKSDLNSQSNYVESSNKRDATKSLQDNFSNMAIGSKIDRANKKLHPEVSKTDMDVFSQKNWMIDLSIALKEAELLSAEKNSNQSDLDAGDSNINSLNGNPQIQSKVVDITYFTLPTTLNLISLRNVRLVHTKQTVSAFGQTLCKNWKLSKPKLKSRKQECHKIKRFDFSIPYRRT